jgi:hypothetical protein
MSVIEAIIEFKVVIIFYAAVFLLVYLNRSKFDVHGKIVFLYRTQIGIKMMNWLAGKASKPVRMLSSIGVIIGFAAMFFVIGTILFLTYKLILNQSDAGGASPVIPGLPIAGTGLVFPLITGWLVLFVIIVVHEFSHGVVASAYRIKIKNSGMAFFGPILGAFVEPDEKILAKQKDWVQHSVFAAGPFSNFLTVLVVFLVAFLIVIPAESLVSVPIGVTIFSQPGLPAEKAGIGNNTLVTGINDDKIKTRKDFQKSMESIGPEREITLHSDEHSYSLTTAANPDDPEKGYLGVWIIEEKTELKNDNILNQLIFGILQWVKQFLWWLYFLSLNIGLINLLPIFSCSLIGSRCFRY